LHKAILIPIIPPILKTCILDSIGQDEVDCTDEYILSTILNELSKLESKPNLPPQYYSLELNVNKQNIVDSVLITCIYEEKSVLSQLNVIAKIQFLNSTKFQRKRRFYPKKYLRFKYPILSDLENFKYPRKFPKDLDIDIPPTPTKSFLDLGNSEDKRKYTLNRWIKNLDSKIVEIDSILINGLDNYEIDILVKVSKLGYINDCIIQQKIGFKLKRIILKMIYAWNRKKPPFVGGKHNNKLVDSELAFSINLDPEIKRYITHKRRYK